MASTKLAVLALLGMLALAAAAEVQPMKKTYKGEDKPEYKDKAGYKDKKDYYPAPSKANVEDMHKVWDLYETVITTHPCEKEYEILGSTVAQSIELSTDDKVVGSAFWSGIVVSHDLCGHCKDYKAKTEHIVKVNYQITFDFTDKHKGQIICGVVADSIFSDDSVTCSVLGGSGAFEGAWGTVTWTSGKVGKYAFDIHLPKVHEVKKDEYKPKKDTKYDDDEY